VDRELRLQPEPLGGSAPTGTMRDWRYDDALRARDATPPVTARQAATGGTMAERVRRRALQMQQEAQAPVPVTPPPVGPSVRSQGPGPRR
jgi:hypothetical protein